MQPSERHSGGRRAPGQHEFRRPGDHFASIVPHERRGAAFGLTATAQAAASVIGPLSAIAIISAADMRTVFTVSAALYALAYVGVIAGFRRHKVGRFRPKAPVESPPPSADPL